MIGQAIAYLEGRGRKIAAAVAALRDLDVNDAITVEVGTMERVETVQGGGELLAASTQKRLPPPKGRKPRTIKPIGRGKRAAKAPVLAKSDGSHSRKANPKREDGFLLFDQGKSINDVAAACGVGYQTAYGWKQQHKKAVRTGATTLTSKMKTQESSAAPAAGQAAPQQAGPKQYWCGSCQKYSANKHQCGYCLMDR